MSEEQEGKELVEIAGRIRDWQQARGMSDAELCAKVNLGSSKTYKACWTGELEGYNIDRWLVTFRQAWAAIELMDGRGDELPTYDDLTPVVRLRAALTEAMREKGLERLIILAGEPGAGKTTSFRSVQERYGSRVLMIEAAETWRDSVNAMLFDLCIGCGFVPPASGAKALEELVKNLRQTRRALFLDESHHMGPRGLNLVKTLINQTPGEVVMMGLPVLLARLMQKEAYQEAKQLVLNRLCEQIVLTSVEPQDAEKVLQRVGGMNAADARTVADGVAKFAKDRGMLRFVMRVARKVAASEDKSAAAVQRIAGRMVA